MKANPKILLLYRFVLAAASVFLAYVVWSAIQTGAIDVGRSSKSIVHREITPSIFWGMVALYALASAVMMLLAVTAKTGSARRRR